MNGPGFEPRGCGGVISWGRNVFSKEQLERVFGSVSGSSSGGGLQSSSNSALLGPGILFPC